MKAAINVKYGPPEVVQVMEVDKPTPKNNEVLIKIYATTVNRTDCGFRSAEYFISRFWSGLLKPTNKILGNEFSGVIESIGSEVTEFKIGDKVFGYNDKTFGTHAEYLCINEKATLTTMPNNLSFTQAAALTEGAHYGLCDIRAAKVKAGQNVLVYGATGAIGSSAVQILKHMGANVTAVCNTNNIALVKSLGADLVIDYTKEDYTKTDMKYDFVFDAVGKTSFGKCKPILNETGIYISTELGKNGQNVFLALKPKFLSKKRVLFPIPTITKEDVVYLKELAEAGKFAPVIDERKFTLNEIIEAYKYVETGQKIGNVVIEIN